MSAGIFKIVNTKTGDVYVGSTSKTNHVWPAYQSLLNRKDSKGVNRRLQELWDNGDPSEFKFELLEESNKRDLPRLKQKWIDKLKPSLNSNTVRQTVRGEKAPRTQVARKAVSFSPGTAMVLTVDLRNTSSFGMIADMAKVAFGEDPDAEVTIHYAGKSIVWKAA